MNPGSFVLVGIGGFFAGVAKTPISAIIMACEMSASYTLLVPLMLVSTTSYLLLRNTSLYEKQQISRIASLAHLTEFARGMLEKIRVHEAIHEEPVTRIPENMPFGDLVKTVTRSGASHFPVVDRDGRMTGIVSINVDELPVVREERPDEIVTMISKRDIVNYYSGRSTS